MKTPQIPVAKEGYPYIFLISFLTLVFALLEWAWLAVPGVILTLFVLNFFRDPERYVPEKEHTVVSPADGKVIRIERIDNEEITGKDVYKISIFMNIFNIHVNRVPFSGTVKKISYTPGKFYSADSDRGGLHNERCVTVMESEHNITVAFVQVAGLIARRIVNHLEIGDTVRKGERFGIIRFGSRVDVYLPADATIAVRMDQRVKAGETIIGYLDLP